MPIDFLNEDELPKSQRKSKIARSKEWGEITSALAKGIPDRQVVQVTFCEATVKEFGDGKKTANAFAIKLRDVYPNYEIAVANGVTVRISNKKDES